MKSMIALPLLFAACSATFTYNYAPGYAYGAYGARTALDVFPYTPAFSPVYASAAYNFPYAATNVVANAETAAVALPAVTANAAEVVEGEAAVVVDDATAANTIRLRPIFPVFDTDLRAGVTEVQFVRPSDVVSIAPVDDASSDDFVVITPETRALPNIAAANPAGIVQASQPRFYSPFRRFF